MQESVKQAGVSLMESLVTEMMMPGGLSKEVTTTTGEKDGFSSVVRSGQVRSAEALRWLFCHYVVVGLFVGCTYIVHSNLVL